MREEKVYIKTWGCQMNTHDSQKLLQQLESAFACVETSDPEEADILVLNTCSIREKAQEKLFHQLGRWRKLKLARPERLIAVGGCVAVQEGEALRRRAPYVDIVFGPQTLQRLPALIQETRKSHQPACDISFSAEEKFDALPPARAEGVSAYVSIMEGCNKYCAYCIVPYTRGPEVSRPAYAILTEIMALVSQGVKEVTLLGQNVNAYGSALPDGKVCMLADLIRAIAQIPEILRIRFITSHPIEFTTELVEVYQQEPKLAGLLHLPIQSGSDAILTKMARQHTVAQYRELVQRLRKARPNLHLSSDFIVGFPGETEVEFNQTLALIKELNMDISYSFLFSPRPGTPAAELPDGTSISVKQQRLQQLQTLVQQQINAHTQQMVGEVVEVLVEEVDATGSTASGKTEMNRTVRFSGAALTTGALARVYIERGKGTLLEGRSV